MHHSGSRGTPGHACRACLAPSLTESMYTYNTLNVMEEKARKLRVSAPRPPLCCLKCEGAVSGGLRCRERRQVLAAAAPEPATLLPDRQKPLHEDACAAGDPTDGDTSSSGLACREKSLS